MFYACSQSQSRKTRITIKQISKRKRNSIGLCILDMWFNDVKILFSVYNRIHAHFILSNKCKRKHCWRHLSSIFNVLLSNIFHRFSFIVGFLRISPWGYGRHWMQSIYIFIYKSSGFLKFRTETLCLRFQTNSWSYKSCTK